MTLGQLRHATSDLSDDTRLVAVCDVKILRNSKSHLKVDWETEERDLTELEHDEDTLRIYAR